MRTRIRHGFTLVELLVVMSIIAMLAGLLLPAVNSVREVGRRTQCINNQRNVALAAIQFNGSTGQLPGWCNPMVDRAALGSATPACMSWVWPLLPYLERGDLYRLGTNSSSTGTYNVTPASWPVVNGAAQANPHLKILVCPNDSTALSNGMNISYVGNAGFREGNGQANLANHAGGNATDTGNWDTSNSAVFVNRFSNGTATMQSNSLEIISGGDGTANTLMFSENIHAGRWGFNNQGDRRESQVSLCFVNSATSDATNKMKINGAITGTTGTAEGNYPGANSYHPNGVVVAFCDSHTAFITQDIAWSTWTLLFTPRGDAVTVPGGGTFVFNGMVMSERF